MGHDSQQILSKKDIQLEFKKLELFKKSPARILYSNFVNFGLGKNLRIVGLDARNNLPIMIKYFCSDVCPAYGGFSLYYQGISQPENCEQINGQNIFDAAWGGFVGCRPRLK
ncbi:hypothetical protein IID20_00950 [Patescibacteria group bacterium]|nr:hypothetical protein [Patescibacteria group bacterium]